MNNNNRPPNGQPPHGRPPNGPNGQPPNGRPQGGGPPGMGRGGPMMGTGEKAKDFSGTLKKLFKYSKKYMGLVIASAIMAVISSLLTIIGPTKLGEISDIIAQGMSTEIDLELVTQSAIVLVAIYVSTILFSYMQGVFMSIASLRIGKSLRTDLVQKVNKLPLSYFDSKSYGDTLSHVTNDVDTISQSLNQSMGSVVNGLLTFVGCLSVMLYTNWIMTLSAILSTILGFALMKLIISKSQGFFSQQQYMLGALNGHIDEMYRGHTVVKAYNGEEYSNKYFTKNNKALYSAAWKAQYLSGLMMPVMQFSGNLAYVVVCIIGAILAMNGYITFGVIVAFMIYVKLFTQPLSALAQAANILQSAAAAGERVFSMLEESELQPEKTDITHIKSANGDVEFKNVKFGYSKDKIIIDGFSAKVKAGQKVAIVGPTGAGKTTMVNLLMRFYEVNSGEIYIDGTPISGITRENIHDIFAMVLQDSWLFEGTISENIAYSQENVTLEEIVNACKAVGIHHTIKTMPKGYDTIMSTATLSEGEKQLITIARAMVKKSDLLILDEATSSVDTRTELLIGKAMDNLAKNKTSFIIAHRLSTIKNADLILVMKDGNIIESGNHEELLAKKGFYAELYNSQFEQAE